jgi:predicted GNAT family acetyltransferase
MALSNYERMIKLADEVFETKDDPNQLDVNEDVIEELLQIHPATVSEYDNGEGPIAWVLLIPTTIELMNQFIECEISEKQLFELTKEEKIFNTIYLCSAMVLEEYRKNGIAKNLVLDAIEMIRQDHSITALFVWSFSKEGDLGAETISTITSIPLYKRKNDYSS